MRVAKFLHICRETLCDAMVFTIIRKESFSCSINDFDQIGTIALCNLMISKKYSDSWHLINFLYVYVKISFTAKMDYLTDEITINKFHELFSIIINQNHFPYFSCYVFPHSLSQFIMRISYLQYLF